MALRLNGSSSGYVELDVPAAAGSHTLTLPDGGGTSGQYLQTNGSGALSWATVTDTTTNLTRSTVVTTTGGSAIDFTDMPTGTRRITIIAELVGASAADRPLIQIGTGGTPETSGYNGRSWYVSTTSDITNKTYDSGFFVNFYSNAQSVTFKMVLENLTGNTWVESHVGSSAGWTTAHLGGGSRTLSGELDIVRLRMSGSSTIARNGGVNCFYEV